jgi:hypothetical protein
VEVLRQADDFDRRLKQIPMSSHVWRHGLEQSVLVRVMAVKDSPVQGGFIGDLLNGNVIDLLAGQQPKQRPPSASDAADGPRDRDFSAGLPAWAAYAITNSIPPLLRQ